MNTPQQDYALKEPSLAGAYSDLSEQEDIMYGVISGNASEYSVWVSPKNRYGVHARPAAKIVRTASKYVQCEINAKKDSTQISASSIMGWMTLEAPCGSKIKLTAKGTDSKKALEEIVALFESKFDEE